MQENQIKVEYSGESMIDTIPLNLQTGDLVTIIGLPGDARSGMGTDHYLGIVVSRFQDEGGRWLANVQWSKHAGDYEFGTYYNYRYNTCTEWVGKVEA